MSNENFAVEGVFAAVLTPQTKDLTPDLGTMAGHCRWLLANGCDGLAVLGTTGEANSFGLKERIDIIEGLVEAGIPGENMMPGTGACAIPDAVSLTRVAIEAGAKTVLMLPPFYYKNPSDDGLFAHFSEVIQRIGDDRLKICLYHFPQMSAVPFSYDLIARLLKAYPETIVGMKDSSGDLENMCGAAKEFPGFAVFAGSDDLLLPLLDAGGAGCITACANVGSALAGEVYQAFKAGGADAAANEKLVQVRQTVYRYPLPPALKALMARHSGNDSWFNIRPPLMRLSDADRKALYDSFDAIGYALPMAA